MTSANQTSAAIPALEVKGLSVEFPPAKAS